MKFYDREQEMAFLKETREKAEKVARFTVVTGRRRIGKTTLVREAYSDKPFVYFLVARTNWLMTPPEMLEIHAIFDTTTFFSFQLSFFLFLRL